jgi:hypothetical protein
LNCVSIHARVKLSHIQGIQDKEDNHILAFGMENCPEFSIVDTFVCLHYKLPAAVSFSFDWMTLLL